MIMMKNLILIFCILLLSMGCVTQQTKYVCSDGREVSNKEECNGNISGGGGQQSILPGSTPQSGCAYNNPPCSSDYNCVNNMCVKKSGCQYSNPSCNSEFDCIDNICIQKKGCAYNNPSCDSDYKCENNICVEKAICGKFGCQEGESSSNCCIDCGCPTGESCENNVCKELKPVINIEYTQNTFYSITIYLSNPSLNIGTLTIKNNGNDDAKNIAVRLSSDGGYFEDETINIGDLAKGRSDTKDYALTFTQKGLELSSEKNDITVNVETYYENSANQQFSDSSSFEIQVYGKNNVVGPYKGWASNYPPWITPDQNAVREFAAKSTAGIATYQSDESKTLAAWWLFSSMRAYGVKYVNERAEIGDYAQFPIETLKRKAGDCEDQAILYASLLEAVGIKSAVVVIPGHAFSGYFTSKGFVPVETTAGNFEDARDIAYQEYNDAYNAGTLDVIISENGWSNLPQVILKKEPSIPMMDIKKQVSDCVSGWDFSIGYHYDATARFQNNGNAPGVGCVLMATYQNGVIRDTDYECWTILAGETVTKELVNDYEMGTQTQCYIE